MFSHPPLETAKVRPGSVRREQAAVADGEVGVPSELGVVEDADAILDAAEAVGKVVEYFDGVFADFDVAIVFEEPLAKIRRSTVAHERGRRCGGSRSVIVIVDVVNVIGSTNLLLLLLRLNVIIVIVKRARR